MSSTILKDDEMNDVIVNKGVPAVVIPATDPNFQVSLTAEELLTMYHLTRKISASPANTVRKYTDSICNKVTQAIPRHLYKPVGDYDYIFNKGISATDNSLSCGIFLTQLKQLKEYHR